MGSQYDIEIEYNNSEDESQWEYELKGEELKVLKEYAKEENKTVQQLFNEIIIEFVDKNIKLIQENEETEDRLKELASYEKLNQDIKSYLEVLKNDTTKKVIIINEDIPKAVIISLDEYEYLLKMKKEKERLDANTNPDTTK